jgi:hypothetical protein
MNYFKINYGSDDDNYDIIFSNKEISQLKVFEEDVKVIFKSKIDKFLKSKECVNQSPFDWVTSSKSDFQNLGYKIIDIYGVFLKYSLPNDYDNISLSIMEPSRVFETNSSSEKILFEVCILSEFDPGNTFSSYFLCSENQMGKFNSEIVNYLNLNPIIFDFEFISYLESLENFISSIGYEVINPITYQISCSYNLENLPNQWKEILGTELYTNIKNIAKPTPRINIGNIISLDNDLPF